MRKAGNGSVVQAPRRNGSGHRNGNGYKNGNGNGNGNGHKTGNGNGHTATATLKPAGRNGNGNGSSAGHVHELGTIKVSRWAGRPWAMLMTDAAALSAAFVIAYHLRADLLGVWMRGIQESSFYFWPGVLAVTICLGSLLFNRLYEDRRYLGHLERHADKIRSMSIGVLLIAALAALFRINDYSRGLLLIFWCVGTCTLCCGRMIFDRLLRRLRAKGFDNIPVATVVLAGDGYVARKILKDYPELGYQVVQEFGITGNKQDARRLEILKEMVNLRQVEMVVIGVPERYFYLAVPYMSWCEENYVPYHRISGVFDVFYKSGRGLEDLMYLDDKPVYSALKRFIDWMLSIALLVVTLPLWLPIAIAIKLESHGPIIFTQERVGRNGKIFNMFKFRSMYAHAAKYALTVRSRHDQRVTKVGKFLRRTSLDELPQLLNVIKGDMSLVGPRPEMPFMVEANSPRYKKRLMVAPGVTGLWQVAARHIPLEKALSYDLYYIKNRSFLFDFVILARTAMAVVNGRGAQ